MTLGKAIGLIFLAVVLAVFVAKIFEFFGWLQIEQTSEALKALADEWRSYNGWPDR
jgi:hypothetical protein